MNAGSLRDSLAPPKVVRALNLYLILPWQFSGMRRGKLISKTKKLRKELDDLRAAAESDLQPGTIDYERYRLTKAQADAQELKNAREDGVVLETELFTFILQRVAQEISGILVRVPLTLQRKYPDISPSHLDVVKTEIAKASNVAAKAGENVGGWIDDFRRAEGS